MKAMPPKLVSDNGRYVVIRPLAYCKESDLAQFATDQRYPIIPCNLCGSERNLKRAEIKAMIADWDKRYPGRVENLFRGLQNIVPSHLMDKELHTFESPGPGELLAYRAENPMGSADEISETSVKAELNLWGESESDYTQIIQTTGATAPVP